MTLTSWLRLSFVVGLCCAFPIHPETNEEQISVPSNSPTSYANIFALLTGFGAIVCLMTVVAGCLCCRKGIFKGFENVQNGSVQESVNSNTEFTIFPPAPCSRQARGSMVDVKFEPLPDIRPRGHGSSSSQPRPANFSSVVNRGLSVQDWFDEPYNNFPRYQLKYLQEVGSGWFGQVVEGEGQGIAGAKKTKVVVKILREDATPTDQIYFLHEVKPFRDLNHPNVLKLLGKCVECDPFLLLFEHCAFKDLRTYLIQHRSESESLIRENLLLRIVYNIAAGLNHMHNNGFIHTDLAARNCLVGSDLQVKIGDYGNSIEKFRDNYYCAGDIAVPIRWCAPESLRCTDTTIETKEVTCEANIWSFGVVLWEVMEFGKLPYFDLHDEDVLQKVIIERLTQLSQPQSNCNHRERIFQIMKLCWLEDPLLRPKMEKLEVLLAHLYRYKDSSVDFEHRWNLLQPKVSRSTNIVATVEDPAAMKFENNFGHRTSIASHPEKWERDALHDLSPSPHPSLNLDFSAANEHTMSPSLQNLRGSLDDMCNPCSLTDQTSVSESELNGSVASMSACFAKPMLANGKVKAASLELLQPHVEVPSSRQVQKEFDAWIVSQQAKGAEASQMAMDISEAMQHLDSAFAHEKGSLSSEGNSIKSTPERDVSQQSIQATGEEAESNLASLTDSLLSDDDTWKEIMGRPGATMTPVTELVKEKSQSVQDFLKLTVIDTDNSSDSDSLPQEMPSINKGVSMSDDALFTRHDKDRSSPSWQSFALTLVNASVAEAMTEVVESLTHDESDKIGFSSVALNFSHDQGADGTRVAPSDVTTNNRLHASNREGQDSALTSSTPTSCTNTVTPRDSILQTDESLLTFRCEMTPSSIEECFSQKHENAKHPVTSRNIFTSTPLLTEKTAYFSACESLKESSQSLSETDLSSFSTPKSSPQIGRSFTIPIFSDVEQELKFDDPNESTQVCVCEDTQEQTLVEKKNECKTLTDCSSVICSGEKSNDVSDTLDSNYYTTANVDESNDDPWTDQCNKNNEPNLDNQKCHNLEDSTSAFAIDSVNNFDTVADVSSETGNKIVQVTESDGGINDVDGTSIWHSTSSSPIVSVDNSAITENTVKSDAEPMGCEFKHDNLEALTAQTTPLGSSNSLNQMCEYFLATGNEVPDVISNVTSSELTSNQNEYSSNFHNVGHKTVNQVNVSSDCDFNSSARMLGDFNLGPWYFQASEINDLFDNYTADEPTSLLVCSKYVPSRSALSWRAKRHLVTNGVSEELISPVAEHDVRDEGCVLTNHVDVESGNQDFTLTGAKGNPESPDTETSQSHQLYVASMNKLNELHSASYKLDLCDIDDAKLACNENVIIFSDIDALSDPDISNDNGDSDFCEKTFTESSFSTDIEPGDDASFSTQDWGSKSDGNDFSESFSIDSYKQATMPVAEMFNVDLMKTVCDNAFPDNCFAMSNSSRVDLEIPSVSVDSDIPELRNVKFIEPVPDWPHDNLLFISDTDEPVSSKKPIAAGTTSSTDTESSEGSCLFELEDINAALAELDETDDDNDIDDDTFDQLPRLNEMGESEMNIALRDRKYPEDIVNVNDSFDEDDDDLLIVDTETNEALLLEGHSSRIHHNDVTFIEDPSHSKRLSDIEFIDDGSDCDSGNRLESAQSDFNGENVYEMVSSESCFVDGADVRSEHESDLTQSSDNPLVKIDDVLEEKIDKSDIETDGRDLFNSENNVTTLASNSDTVDGRGATSKRNLSVPQIVVVKPEDDNIPSDDHVALSPEQRYKPDWESESDSGSSHEASSTSGEFDCSKYHVDGTLRVSDHAVDEVDENIVPFKISSWNKDATPTKSSFLSPDKKKLKKSVSFNTSEQLVIFEYPHEEKVWDDGMLPRSSWHATNSTPQDLENYAEWEFGEEEISEDIIEINDPDVDDGDRQGPPFYRLATNSFYNLGNFQNETETDEMEDEASAEDIILYNTDQGALSFRELLEHYGGNPFYPSEDGSMPDLYLSELETAYAMNPNAAYNYQFLPYLTAESGFENNVYVNGNGNLSPDDETVAKQFDPTLFQYFSSDGNDNEALISVDDEHKPSNVNSKEDQQRENNVPSESDDHQIDESLNLMHKSPRRWMNFADLVGNSETPIAADNQDSGSESHTNTTTNGLATNIESVSPHYPTSQNNDHTTTTLFTANSSPSNDCFGAGNQELLI